MPILGSKEPLPLQPSYFKSLKDLDSWSTSASAASTFDRGLPFTARKQDVQSATRGKLLVCHDYKGGYTESSFARSYTFNFWSACDTFVYFSHHRVTVPPPGWISAAHRQGVKMLGTLIFEPGGEEDCLRLLVGQMPTSTTGQVDQATSSFTLPLSPHYARILADLARDRGFDGYLLNFEHPLAGGLEQTRALAAWITLLQSEILEKVGPHGETLWYDSVVINGQLAWQDRLNSYNLPFLLSSSGLFSNYTWRNDYPARTAQYFLSLDQSLIGNNPQAYSQRAPKTLRDIYMGIDIWGRGSHGGGGFGAYKALTHISPESLGLSVAIFGQAWSWESEQDKDGWTWDKWWEYDSKLWVGSIDGNDTVEVPEAPKRKGEPECVHGPFLPITSFFPRQPPPDPAGLVFHTTFCPGTGLGWFVEGTSVFQSKGGWTDVDKQTSVGDMVWPRPKLYWEDKREDEKIPTALSFFCMDDAWNGGNSLQLSITCPGSEDETVAYRSVWLPVQSLRITPHRTYQATAVYKLGELADGIDTEFALSFQPVPDSEDDKFVFDVTSSATEDLPHGWTKLTIQFSTSTNDSTSTPPSTLAFGLVIAILAEEPAKPVELAFLLGQVDVSASLPHSFTEDDTLILWANFSPRSSAASTSSQDSAPLTGDITWEVTTTFPKVSTISITSPEDPLSAWNVQPTIAWFPIFLYFNIYVQPFADAWTVGKVDQATWIGTSGAGLSGKKNIFSVLPENLPFEVSAKGKKVRFYVQGVTEGGEVLKWDRCAFVDVTT